MSDLVDNFGVLLDEAADRIEALEAALREIDESNSIAYQYQATGAIGVARAALDQSSPPSATE